MHSLQYSLAQLCYLKYTWNYVFSFCFRILWRPPPFNIMNLHKRLQVETFTVIKFTENFYPILAQTPSRTQNILQSPWRALVFSKCTHILSLCSIFYLLLAYTQLILYLSCVCYFLPEEQKPHQTTFLALVVSFIGNIVTLKNFID